MWCTPLFQTKNVKRGLILGSKFRFDVVISLFVTLAFKIRYNMIKRKKGTNLVNLYLDQRCDNRYLILNEVEL